MLNFCLEVSRISILDNVSDIAQKAENNDENYKVHSNRQKQLQELKRGNFKIKKQE